MHRSYEEKYNNDSQVLETFPWESDRIAHIIKILQKHVIDHTVTCLQEVSTETLQALIESFGQTHKIFYYNIRDDEYLVTLTPFREAASGELDKPDMTFEQNPNFTLEYGTQGATANGYLVVTNGKYRVVNCHLLPQRFVNEHVLEYLKTFDKSDEDITVVTFIAGDYNECYNIVEDVLNDMYICPFYGKTYKKRAIDHIVFTQNGPPLYKSAKVYSEYASDHHMIYLDII
jgi:hypothetical protein